MKRRHNRVGLAAGGVAVFMLGAAYAAVPIYKLICQATGLGGTPGTVSALVVSATDLYVGGSFSTAGGVGAGGVARWNGTAWSSLGPTGTNGPSLPWL